MSGEEPNQEQLRLRFQERLRAELTDIAVLSKSAGEARAPVILDQQSVGRLSRMDAMQGQALAQATERRREMRRVALQQALKRIEDGDFGYCLDCDEPIPEKRLDIDPATTHCINCAQRIEQ